MYFFPLNAQYLMLEDILLKYYLKPYYLKTYSRASNYRRMSLIGNKCLLEITVIGSLNASVKPLKM